MDLTSTKYCTMSHLSNNMGSCFWQRHSNETEIGRGIFTTCVSNLAWKNRKDPQRGQFEREAPEILCVSSSAALLRTYSQPPDQCLVSSRDVQLPKLLEHFEGWTMLEIIPFLDMKLGVKRPSCRIHVRTKPEGVHRLLSHAAYFLGYCFCLPVSLCFEKYEKCFLCEFCSCMSDFAKSPSGSRIFVWKLIDSSAVLSVLSWPSNGHRYGSAWPSTEQHPATFCNTPLKLTQSKSHQENQML